MLFNYFGFIERFALVEEITKSNVRLHDLTSYGFTDPHHLRVKASDPVHLEICVPGSGLNPMGSGHYDRTLKAAALKFRYHAESHSKHFFAGLSPAVIKKF